MTKKEQHPGGVKLTAKTARTLAMQEFGTEEIRMKAGCSMSQAEKLSEWSPWITPSGLYC